MTERSGVEIDYCPDCRGVWLDRGELDKIIERSSQPLVAVRQVISPEKQHYSKDQDYRYKKKKSFMSDLFDF